MIRRNVPEVRERTPEGKPGSRLGMEVYGVDGSKAVKLLGLKSRNWDTCTPDEVKGFVELEKRLGKV